jgi:SAM-dependent methyltransferase
LSRNWYLDNPFWQTFGEVMFDQTQFDAANNHLPDLMALAGRTSGDVLDLGCGPGRYALPLAEAGFSVCAVDTSEALLGQLDDRMAQLDATSRARIEPVNADMREFSRPEAFDWVMVMWSTFGYFEDEADHGRVLDNIYQSLRANGTLVLDLVGLEYLCRTLEPVHLTEFDDGRLLIERPVLVDDMTRLDNEWLLVDGETVTRATFSHRVWSGGELTHLLAQHGLRVVGVYGDYTGTPYDMGSERMVVVAEREELA